jgi:uncharacterized protein (DUF2147 family)
MTPHIAAFLAAAISIPAVAVAQPPDPSGTWLTQSGEARIRIARCGPVWCGTIAWVSGPPKDSNNPDPAKRDRNLVGLQMISDIRPSGDGFEGRLYNFQDGRTYIGRMKLRGQNAMEMSGCALGGLICRRQTWARVD